MYMNLAEKSSSRGESLMTDTTNDSVQTTGGAQRTNILEGDVAIVTGSSRGIGRAIVERLATDGASVLVNYVTNDDAARDVVAAIDAAGGDALAVQGDVSEAGDVEQLFDEAEAAFGSVDIVVNAAGTSVCGPIAEFAETDFDRVFDVNAKGTFFVLREAANRITDDGRIVDLSTVGTVRGDAGVGPYAGSKAASEQMVTALADELGERNIRVNTVSPGVTDTDGLIMSDETVERMVEQTPLGRRGQAADVADVVVFLVSNDGRWLTGQNLRATGGWEIGW